MYKYALNAADILELSHIPLTCLVEPAIRDRCQVDAEPNRIDGIAVVLQVEDQRAEAIIDILRHGLPSSKAPTFPGLRAYRRNKHNPYWWVKIPKKKRLTG